MRFQAGTPQYFLTNDGIQFARGIDERTTVVEGQTLRSILRKLGRIAWYPNSTQIWDKELERYYDIGQEYAGTNRSTLTAMDIFTGDIVEYAWKDYGWY